MTNGSTSRAPGFHQLSTYREELADHAPACKCRAARRHDRIREGAGLWWRRARLRGSSKTRASRFQARRRRLCSCRFAKLPPPKAKKRTGSSGLGLGLYIAREIATAHGGAIDVTSNNDGTTFCVSLPRTPFVARQKGQRLPPSLVCPLGSLLITGTRKRVLVDGAKGHKFRFGVGDQDLADIRAAPAAGGAVALIAWAPWMSNHLPAPRKKINTSSSDLD